MSTESPSLTPIKVEALSQSVKDEATETNETTSSIHTYLELVKPRILILLLLIALAGFGVAGKVVQGKLLINLSIGIALIGAATGTLNQWWERDSDKEMLRTKERPLPTNRISTNKALSFGILTSILGIGYLAYFVNPLSSLIGLLTIISYVFFYTPLKSKSSLSTVIGAFPGATPPLIGWVAVNNQIDTPAIILFLIMFFWQFPHFLAIAWMYREDYTKAGIKMLPILESDGFATGRQILLYALVLLPVSLLPTIIGLCGKIYFVGALILGSWYLYHSFLTARLRSWQQAKNLLKASVIYLPLLFLLMLLNKN